MIVYPMRVPLLAAMCFGLATAQIAQVCLRLGEIDDVAYKQRPVAVKQQFLSMSRRGDEFAFVGEGADVIRSPLCDDRFCHEIVAYLQGPPMWCAQVLNAGTGFSAVTARNTSTETCSCDVNKLADVCTVRGPMDETCIRPHQTCACRRSPDGNSSQASEMGTITPGGLGDYFSTCIRLGQIAHISFEARPTRHCLQFANATWQGTKYVYCDHCAGQPSVSSPVCDESLCGDIVSQLKSFGCEQVGNAGSESPLRARLLSKTECSCEVCKVAEICTAAAAPGEGCVLPWQYCNCTNDTSSSWS